MRALWLAWLRYYHFHFPSPTRTASLSVFQLNTKAFPVADRHLHISEELISNALLGWLNVVAARFALTPSPPTFYALASKYMYVYRFQRGWPIYNWQKFSSLRKYAEELMIYYCLVLGCWSKGFLYLEWLRPPQLRSWLVTFMISFHVSHTYSCTHPSRKSHAKSIGNPPD